MATRSIGITYEPTEEMIEPAGDGLPPLELCGELPVLLWMFCEDRW